MIEQYGKDIEQMEHTTAAESTKLLMKLMSLIRQRVDKNKVLVDFETGRPSEVQIYIDHKNVFKGTENNPKLSSSIDPKSLESVANLLNLPDGKEVDLPYKNISIKINDQEVFKYENGKVVLNALAPQVSDRSLPFAASDTTKPLIPQEQIDQMTDEINEQEVFKYEAPQAKDRSSPSVASNAIKPLTRQEQLDKMTKDLQGLELIDSLRQIVKEKGIDQVEPGNLTEVKTLQYKDYLFVATVGTGFAIIDKNEQTLFHQEVGKVKKNSLSDENWRDLKTFVKESQQEKENTTHEKEEIEID